MPITTIEQALKLELSPTKKLGRLLRLERRDVAAVLVYAITLGILSLAVPLAVQLVVNYAAMQGLVQPALVVSAALALALCATVVVRVLQSKVVESLQRRVFVRVVDVVVSRIALSCDAGTNNREKMNRYFDIFTLQKAAVSLLVDALDAAVVAVVGVGVLALYHPALLVFDVLLLATLAVSFYVAGIGGVRTSLRESSSKYQLADWLQRAAGDGELPDDFRDRSDELVRDHLQKRDDHFKVFVRQLVAAWTTQAAALILLLVIGTWLVGEGQLSLGQLVAAELIVAAVAASIRKLAVKAEVFYDAVAAVEKVSKLIAPYKPTESDS